MRKLLLGGVQLCQWLGRGAAWALCCVAIRSQMAVQRCYGCVLALIHGGKPIQGLLRTQKKPLSSVSALRRGKSIGLRPEVEHLQRCGLRKGVGEFLRLSCGHSGLLSQVFQRARELDGCMESTE